MVTTQFSYQCMYIYVEWRDRFMTVYAKMCNNAHLDALMSVNDSTESLMLFTGELLTLAVFNLHYKGAR